MENNIRILVVTNTYPSAERPGETPNIKDQINELEGLGVLVDLFYIDHIRKINYLWAMLKIFMLSFQRKRYDLIHAFYGHSGVLAKFQFKYPVVVTFLGSDLLGKKDGVIGKFIAKFVDGVIVMTEEMKIASGRRDARVIPFDADTATFTPSLMSEARADLGLPSNKKLILFPWNPSRPEKKFDLAQEAVEIVNKQQDIELLAVFNQSRETIAKYMNACDAMILTSRHEGSPLAVREALVSHLPVVSVDVGDVRTLVEKANGGYIAKSDAADLAQKILSVIRGNNNFFDQGVRNADERAAQKVLNLYRQVISRATGT